MTATEIPKTGRAAVVQNPGPDFTVECREDFDVPTPGPTDLLLRLNATGICHSDIHFMAGDWHGAKTQVNCSGHEGAGVVVAIGERVQGWKVGDRGGVKPVWDTCHECTNCRTGKETWCSTRIWTGLNKEGTYSQYILSPARYTTRIPDGVSDYVAGPIMCSGGTVYSALKSADLKAGNWVVIPGAGGGVGHMGVQYAKAMGLRVIAIDTGDAKRDLCLSLGAEKFIDFNTVTDIPAEVTKLTGGLGAHGVVVTGGTKSAYEQAPYLLRVGGVMVCVGMPTSGTATAGADPVYLIVKRITIKGSLVSSMVETDEALDFVARGLVKPIYQVYSFKDLPLAVQALKEGKVAGRGVVDFNK